MSDKTLLQFPEDQFSEEGSRPSGAPREGEGAYRARPNARPTLRHELASIPDAEPLARPDQVAHEGRFVNPVVVQSSTAPSRRRRRRCRACRSVLGEEARFCPFDGEPLADSEVAPPSDPLVGQVLGGRYFVRSVLGEGGMGVVYEVRHQALQRSFALKLLRADLAQDGNLSERFLREARAAAAIDHPHVVRITDFGRLPASSGERGGQSYFVMELLEGQSLRQSIRRGPLPPLRAAHIARQVAEGLGAAHRAGVIHRDLKPDNIHLGSEGESATILDFGLAQLVGAARLTRRGMAFGTPQYMSPEQASGGEVDHRADIYALGIVLYEMVTGQVPFEADSYMGVLTQHMYQKPRPPRDLVTDVDLGGLEAIILRCLAKSPQKRFASAIDLIDALERGDARRSLFPRRNHTPHQPRLIDESAGRLSDERIPSVPLSIPGLHPRLRPYALAGTGAAAVLVAGVLGVVLSSSNGPRPAAPTAPGREDPAPKPAVSPRVRSEALPAVTARGDGSHSEPRSTTPTVVTAAAGGDVDVETPTPSSAADDSSKTGHQSERSPPPTSRASTSSNGTSDSEIPGPPTRKNPFGSADIVDPWAE